MEGVLRLNLRAIPQGASRIEMRVGAADLDLTGLDGDVSGPIDVSLEIVRTGEQLQIRGVVQTLLDQRCVRCLAPVQRDLRGELQVVARRQEQRLERATDGEGILYHDGESLALAGEVREVIVLEIPATPVCRLDCVGLCPRCGADRNAGPCGCPADPGGEPRLKTLEVLRRAVPHERT